MGERFEKLRTLLDRVERVASGRWEISGISLNDGSISIRTPSARCIIAYVTNAISFGDFVNAAMRGRRDFGAPDTASAQHDHANLIIEARNQLPEVLAALDAAEARVKRLEEALTAVLADIAEYERINNLAPSSGAPSAGNRSLLATPPSPKRRAGSEDHQGAGREAEAGYRIVKRRLKMTDDQVKYMTERFLQWKLPEDFNPDGGISFSPTYNDGRMKHNPVGTNLLSHNQATEMVRFMCEGLPPAAAMRALEEIAAERRRQVEANVKMTKEEFCRRFKAQMLAAVPGATFDVAAYADETAPTYWEDEGQRADGPEECAAADISYWEVDG